ncbi:hypothetical protein HK096_005949, partial [Nowakowskiella sp. JEL0078]
MDIRIVLVGAGGIAAATSIGLYYQYNLQREAFLLRQEEEQKNLVFSTARNPANFQEFRQLISKYRYPKTDIRDDEGNTPFILACMSGNLEAVRHILTLANTTTQDICRNPVILSTNLDGHTAFHEAIRLNQLAVVRFLLGFTTLLSFALVAQPAGFVDPVGIVVGGVRELDRDWRRLRVRREDKTMEVGWVGLHFAVAGGSREIVDVLLKSRADVDSKGGNGQTPLMIASVKGDFEIVCSLLKVNANVTLRDGDGRTSLHYAAQNGNLDIVTAILVKNSEMKGVNSGKPIRESKKVRNGSSGTIDRITREDLKRKSVANLSANTTSDILNACDNQGISPLHLAVIFNHTEVVNELIARGAEYSAEFFSEKIQIFKPKVDGQHFTLLLSGTSVMHILVFKRQINLIQSLLGHVAFDPDLTTQDESGRTYLGLACHLFSSHTCRTQPPIISPPSLKFNLPSTPPATPSHRDPQPHLSLLTNILSRPHSSSFVNHHTRDTFTALFVVCAAMSETGQAADEAEAIIRLLLDNGANPTVEESDGWCCLHVLANAKSSNVVDRVYLALEAHVRATEPSFMDLFVRDRIRDIKKSSYFLAKGLEGDERAAVLDGDVSLEAVAKIVKNFDKLKTPASTTSSLKAHGSTALNVRASVNFSKGPKMLNIMVLRGQSESTPVVNYNLDTFENFLKMLDNLKTKKAGNPRLRNYTSFLKILEDKKLLTHIYTSSKDGLEHSIGLSNTIVSNLNGSEQKLNCLLCAAEFNSPNVVQKYWDSIEALKCADRNNNIASSATILTTALSRQRRVVPSEGAENASATFRCSKCGFGILVPEAIYVESMKSNKVDDESLDNCDLLFVLDIDFENPIFLKLITSVSGKCPR